MCIEGTGAFGYSFDAVVVVRKVDQMHLLAVRIETGIQKERPGLVVGQMSVLAGHPLLKPQRVRTGSEHLNIIVGFQKENIGLTGMIHHLLAVLAGIGYYHECLAVDFDPVATASRTVMAGIETLNAERSDLLHCPALDGPLDFLGQIQGPVLGLAVFIASS